MTWPEAIALGIDDLEHGPVFFDTEFAAEKKPDECPPRGSSRSSSWVNRAIDSPEVKKLIDDLVSHPVASLHTACLRGFCSHATSPSAARDSGDVYGVGAKLSHRQSSHTGPLTRRSNAAQGNGFRARLRKAGGLLIAGPDPTGNGGVLPGFGDQRESELLVEAGFTPVEAIHIATDNGAVYLDRQD